MWFLVTESLDQILVNTFEKSKLKNEQGNKENVCIKPVLTNYIMCFCCN
jgi:hypothetical protein